VPEIETGAPSQLKPQITSASKPAPAANPQAKTAPKTQAPATAQAKLAAESPVAVPQSGDSDEGDDSAPVIATANAPEQISVASPQTATAKVIASAPSSASSGIVADDASQDSDETQAGDTSKSHASPTGVQNAAPRSAAARASLANPGQDNAAKTDTIKSGTGKPHALPTQANGAADSDKSAAPKSDDVKAAVSQPEAAPAVAPKAAPVQDIAAIDTITAPQAPTSSAAPATVTQHIQVTAHGAPDLPALAVEIAAKSQSGAKQFDIRLDPPELGRVEVRLSIDAAGKASAHLSADQPQTLSLLQKDAPALTRALRDAGLDVSQNGLNFSLRQQGENASGNTGNNGRRGSSRNFALSASLTVDATTGSTAYRGAANGRLDIRV
jgi:flagellar hook-length control protein FliK